ncbi:peroxidase-like [Trichoplusia ni]|uniref:Peroxidase-like n=1 Tax=Trichoplusia ni TaxID=7111 RepID=A0A7E5WEZ8_TRINI|nr:peroxidase-like [Trichoplusia ni]
MWFFREHNRIARRLAKINPCWDDETLFQKARQISIAQWQYIIYYELMPEILGKKTQLYLHAIQYLKQVPQSIKRQFEIPGRQYSLEKGIIYQTDGYVNDFDPQQEPGVIREYIVGTRWFHTFQPEKMDYYHNGEYRGSVAIADFLLRSSLLADNSTELELTEGHLIQPANEFDQIITNDMAERVFGPWQVAADLSAIDIMRGRDAGFPPYNEYRKFCGLKPAKKWEDLYDTINKDVSVCCNTGLFTTIGIYFNYGALIVETLSRFYEDVDDMELMVAIYVERLVPGTFVGPTLHCIMVHNLLLWRKSDKFFFEHGGFPAALTIPQLTEIRKTSIARVICDNGVNVKKIQPAAFFRQGPW